MVKITKKASQDPSDSSLQMKIRQYLVFGRRDPSATEANPPVLAIRVFAKNTVIAKSKFWYHMRKQQKLKSAQGQILGVHQIYERNNKTVKTYGIVLKYQSRTGNHNMYKEFRDVTLNGAVSQLYMEMSGNHRANHDTIHIIRTSVLTQKSQIRRPKSLLYRDNGLKFPIIKTFPRASNRRFRTIFKANRPSTLRA